jgi:hypothetical protein
VLKPKGNLTVAGSVEERSPRGGTRLGGSWPVVRLWELEAERLLAAGDAGLVPWVPRTRSTLPPEELMARCRDRLAQVTDKGDRAGLMAVTQILAGLAFPDKRFLDLFGGAQAMIESPVLDEVKEILRKRYVQQTLRETIRATLEARFGAVPAERVAALDAVADEAKLKELVRLAATCADLDAFAKGLAGGL